MLKRKILKWFRQISPGQSAPDQTPCTLGVESLENRMLLSSVIQADYIDDFSTTNPSSDWDYLWNAPSDWTGSSSEDAFNNRFGDPENYVSLENVGHIFRPSDEPTTLLEPNRNLHLSKTGGRVGAGFLQNSSNNLVSRYAIAAWTVQEDGFHAISDSRFTTNSTGLNVIVHVNDEDRMDPRGPMTGQCFNPTAAPTGPSR